MMLCELPMDVNSCPLYDKEKKICNNENKCSFQKSEERVINKYERKERWYEQYYRKRR